MELITNPNPGQMIHSPTTQKQQSKSSFIEANTQKVTLEHLRDDCIIPVFSKDNESTISHYQFIKSLYGQVQDFFPEHNVNAPDIRVSHIVKGRIPSAIGKPAKELLEHEKTIYYERCAFVLSIPQIKHVVNGNELSLTIGGVRSLSQENLYSKKSLEKFKVFIGFKNKVCTNLCVSTDGLANEIKIGSILDLDVHVSQLLHDYNQENHLNALELMGNYKLTEKQFANMIGRARMYQHLSKSEQVSKFSFALNDSQINSVVKDYYNDVHFGREADGSINVWNLYNLFTEANKSSYIDSNLERNVNAYEFINNLAFTLGNDSPNWFLN